MYDNLCGNNYTVYMKMIPRSGTTHWIMKMTKLMTKTFFSFLFVYCTVLSVPLPSLVYSLSQLIIMLKILHTQNRYFLHLCLCCLGLRKT